MALTSWLVDLASIGINWIWHQLTSAGYWEVTDQLLVSEYLVVDIAIDTHQIDYNLAKLP